MNVIETTVLENHQIWNFISILHDYKNLDVICYNNLAIADKVIVSSCDSGRKIKAVAENIMQYLKYNCVKYLSEGVESGHWALIETENVIIHIFRQDVRSYYDIDRFLLNGE